MAAENRKHPLAKCEECPLQTAPCVPTTGPSTAGVAFVSRSPGKHDVRTQKPFGGPSGKVLDHLLSKYGIDRKEIITTNVVLCQTDDPPRDAIRACSTRLNAEIQDVDLIIAGGTEATNVLTRYRGVSRARGFSIGRTNPVSGRKQRVVVTNNPAMVMRNSDAYPDMVSDFRRAFDPPPPPTFPKVEIIDDAHNARAILRKWLNTRFRDPLASDLEWHGRRIECAGFSRDGKKAVVFGGSAVSDGQTLSLLRKFYERRDINFIWHNGKSDTKTLRRNEIAGRVNQDTFLLSYALDERPGYHKLEYLLSDRFGWPDYETKAVTHFKKTGEFLEPVNRSRYELYKYNGWDAAGTLQLYDLLRPQLEQNNVVELYGRLLVADATFKEVELNGFNYDIEEACNI
jgi:uracil-DNA glycosylase family 4